MQTILDKALRFFKPQKLPHQIKSKYEIPDRLRFNLERTEDGWFIITSDDLPGFMTQARSKEELGYMVNEAILSYFDVPKIESDYVYDHITLDSGEVLELQLKQKTA